jgi:hypothetical protein
VVRPEFPQRGTDRFSIGMFLDCFGQLQKRFRPHLNGNREKGAKHLKNPRSPLPCGEDLERHQIVNRKKDGNTSPLPQSC